MHEALVEVQRLAGSLTVRPGDERCGELDRGKSGLRMVLDEEAARKEEQRITENLPGCKSIARSNGQIRATEDMPTCSNPAAQLEIVGYTATVQGGRAPASSVPTLPSSTYKSRLFGTHFVTPPSPSPCPPLLSACTPPVATAADARAAAVLVAAAAEGGGGGGMRGSRDSSAATSRDRSLSTFSSNSSSFMLLLLLLAVPLSDEEGDSEMVACTAGSEGTGVRKNRMGRGLAQ